MKAKKILVTGGGGFLGKAIVRKLCENDVAVSSFSRSYYKSLDGLDVLQIQGDLFDKVAIENAVKNVDAVFHVAAKAGLWGSYEDYYKANVIGTENVILACQKHKVGQLIYTSSPSVIFSEGDQENIDETVPYPESYLAHYPATKALAEQLVIKAAKKGLSSIIIRPHLIWGPEDNHLFPKLVQRAGRLKIIGRRDDLVDTIYVDNAADVHILAFQKLQENPALSGNIYFASQDDPISKWKLANAFFEIAGKPPIKGHISARTAFIAGAFFEFVYKLFGVKKDPPMTKFAAVELATSHWFNITKAKKELGYVPKISTRQGLEYLGRWYSTVR